MSQLSALLGTQTRSQLRSQSERESQQGPLRDEVPPGPVALSLQDFMEAKKPGVLQVDVTPSCSILLNGGVDYDLPTVSSRPSAARCLAQLLTKLAALPLFPPGACGAPGQFFGCAWVY